MPVINLPTIVKGNTFSLAIPLQVYIVQDDELVLVDYVPESGDNITVRLKGERRNYTYIPSTNANIAYIHLGGNELVGLYAVEVEIVKDDDSKLTSFRLSQLNIVESIDEISGTELIDNVEQGVIYLNPEIFVAGEGGRGIVSITLTGTSGLVDTYTITYTDNTTSTFTVTNGEDGRSEQSDWAQTDPSADDYIKNKPSLATVATSGSYNDLLNKPTLPAAQVQSDWNVSDISSKAYIKNKPTIDTALSSSSTNAVQNKAVKAALDTKVNTSDLASVTEDSEGADLVGYGTNTDGGTTTNVSVKDALDEIYESIGDGGDLATRVTALEGGKEDKFFIITVTVSYNSQTDRYTILSCDRTMAEMTEAYAADKKMLVVLKKGTDTYLVPLTYADEKDGKELVNNFYFVGYSNKKDESVRCIFPGTVAEAMVEITKLQTKLTFDTAPTASSTNPVTSGGVKTALDAKQATLVSGTSIKTVNNTSLLGSGNVAVQPTLVSGTNIKTVNSTSLLGSGDVTINGSNVNYTGSTGNVITANTSVNTALAAIDTAIGNVETLLASI